MSTQSRPQIAAAEARANPPIIFPKTNRTRRIYIPPILLHLIVAVLGSTIALVTCYALRKLGY